MEFGQKKLVGFGKVQKYIEKMEVHFQRLYALLMKSVHKGTRQTSLVPGQLLFGCLSHSIDQGAGLISKLQKYCTKNPMEIFNWFGCDDSHILL